MKNTLTLSNVHVPHLRKSMQFKTHLDRKLAPLLMLLAFALAPGVAYSTDATNSPAPAAPPTTAPQISVQVSADKVDVDARYFLHGKTLALFNVMAAENLPAGQTAFIENLQIRDASGKLLTASATPDGDWVLEQGDQPVSVRYTVKAGHGDYRWPAGSEEVAYRTPEGLFFTGYALFIVPADKMDGDIQVQFHLPAGWQAHTPWMADAQRFRVATRRELLANALFLGKIHHERLQEGDFRLDLVLGKPYVADRERFVRLLQATLQQARSIFGRTPARKQYLVIVNDGFADGGAFEGSFSQLISGPATDANRTVWGVVMAHELLHFWNGISMVPASVDEEWFKEGFTDYLTAIVLHRSGQFDQAWFFKRLETMYSRHAIGRYYQRSPASFRQAGHDKQPLRTLVYGGGALVAMVVEAEMRDATQGRKGVADLLRALYDEFGNSDRRYTQADIVRHIRALSGVDMQAFFDRHVDGNAFLHIEPWLERMGLTLTPFIEEAFITPSVQAGSDARRNFRAAWAAPGN